MKKPKASYAVQLDLQCSVCGVLTAADVRTEPAYKAGRLGEGPRFCARCGAGYERYCLACRRRAPMFFEEYWPHDLQCVRTYSPAHRCPWCKAELS